jgi:protease-4
MMYEELRNFRAETGKPVVAAMLDVAASGGYYLACACDQIWAQPSTITGSIGVIMMTPNVTDTLSMIGARMITFTSGPMKDAGSPFRPMKPEEKAHFQHLIDTMYADFLAIVDQGRPKLSEQQIRPLADGRVYLGRDAFKAGLVDQIGSLDDAITAAQQLAGLSDEKIIVVQYARPIAYRPNIYAQPATPMTAPTSGNLSSIPWPFWLEHSTPSFLYLWAPGW